MRRTYAVRTYLNEAEWRPLAAAAARVGCAHSVVLRRALAAGLPLLEKLSAGRPGMPEWETALHLFPLSED